MDWQELPADEKEIYLQKARYLIEYRYVEMQDVQELAMKIYSQEKK